MSLCVFVKNKCFHFSKHKKLIFDIFSKSTCIMASLEMPEVALEDGFVGGRWLIRDIFNDFRGS
jgi:hypothetical protein